MLFHLIARSFSFPAEPQRRNAETTTRPEASSIVARDQPGGFTCQAATASAASSQRTTAVPVAIAASMPLSDPAVK